MTITNMEFYVVMPAAATNEVLNPSFELATTGATAYGAGVTLTRVTTEQRYGLAALRVNTATGVASGMYIGSHTEQSGVARTLKVAVKGTAGQAGRIYIADSGGSALTTQTFTFNGYWQEVKVTRTGTANVSTRRLYVVRDAVASTAAFYIDGVYYSTVDGTYLDGDMRGFVKGETDYGWNGTPHASTSWRTARTRSGGTLLRIKDYARIIVPLGLGMAQFLNFAAPVSHQGASSVYQTTRPKEREFVLPMVFTGANPGAVQANRQAIINAVRPDAVPSNQPILMLYKGLDSTSADGSETLEIKAHYVDGLENTAAYDNLGRADVRFTSYLPYIERAGNDAAVMGYQTSVSNFANIGYKDIDGQWKAMGTGCNGAVSTLAVGPDGAIYAGGAFTLAGGVANTVRIAKWNGSAWSALSTGANDAVGAIVFAPDGTMYAGGAFTTIGGVAANRIAKWNGSAWSALGSGLNGSALSLAVGPDGLLYVAGSFNSAGGVADTAGIAKWDGANWSTVGGGVNAGSSVNSIVFGPDGTLYAGGSWTAAGGVAGTANIAQWDGTAWSPLGLGTIDSVLALEIGTDGMLYAGGTFSAIGGVSASRIARWNGNNWTALGAGVGSGISEYVYEITRSPDGGVAVGGSFTTANGLELPDRGVIYQNGTYTPLDINVQDVSAYFYTFAYDGAGRMYIGGDWAGTTALSATVTTTNAAGVRAYPIFTVTGPGTLWGMQNNETGAAVYFNALTLLAGETITVDLSPGRVLMKSSWSGRVSVENYLTDASNLDFFLQGGSNNVSVFLTGTTAASYAYATWKPMYHAIDGAAR